MANQKKTKKSSKTNQGGVDDSMTDNDNVAEEPLKSSAELLSETIKSGIGFVASVIDETKRVKQDAECVMCDSISKELSNKFEHVSKVVTDMISPESQVTPDTETEITREEFDLLKLDVIKLQAKLAALLKEKE